jgi:predicted metal-dependent phosphoesterase TrpH
MSESIKENDQLEDDQGKIRIDLHCHSEASWDCLTPIEAIPAQCQRRGIHIQAITDHNEIWGAEKLKALVENNPEYNLKVIIGEEITTLEGEIIGLFLQQKIEAGLTPEETIRKIREQNGLVLLPHGFDPLKRYRLQPDARARVADQIDIIEAFNARISRPRWNRTAAIWAGEHKLPISAGSDAHRLVDIGDAWVEVPAQPINGPADLLRILYESVPTGNWTHPVLAFIKKMWSQLKTKIGL